MTVNSRIEHFQRLVASQPENELFRFSLAQALLAENRGEEARPHFEYCIAKKSDWMMPRIILGKWLLKNASKAEARPLLEAALALAIEQNHDDPAHELSALLSES